METGDYKRTIRILERELDEMNDALENRPNISVSDVEQVKCLLSGIAKAETIIAMRESGYSGRGYSYGEDDMRIDYRREGRDTGRRDDLSRNDYRQDDGDRADVIAMLKKHIHGERDDRRREAYEEILRKLTSGR